MAEADGARPGGGVKIRRHARMVGLKFAQFSRATAVRNVNSKTMLGAQIC
jgi:hypothetical protein